MARSLITEDQVTDVDFVSHVEHADPLEVVHTFLMSIDTPTTYSGSRGKALAVNYSETGVGFVDFSIAQSTHEYPRYYVEPDVVINVNDFGQYVIAETGYLEVAGVLEFNNGSMLIIKQRE